MNVKDDGGKAEKKIPNIRSSLYILSIYIRYFLISLYVVGYLRLHTWLFVLIFCIFLFGTFFVLFFHFLLLENKRTHFRRSSFFHTQKMFVFCRFSFSYRVVYRCRYAYKNIYVRCVQKEKKIENFQLE